MKILLAYLHYPCSIARFWKRGLQKLGHEVHSIGEFTEGRQAWPGNPNLSHWMDEPDYQLKPARPGDVVHLIGSFLQPKNYDLFINVDAACWFKGPTPGCPKVIIGTDPHCLNYDGQRQDCNLFINMQNYYSKPGDVWIPYAYDEDWYYHDSTVKVNHDVTFYGVLYQERKHDLRRLNSAGLAVEYGDGAAEYKVFSDGSPRYSAGHLAYCRPSLLDLPARFFEALAYGNIPLITKVPDLDLFPDLVQGVHYEVFNDMDLVSVAQRAIVSPDLEDRKAQCMEVAKKHTWAVRAQTLLDICKGKGLIS